MHRLKLILFLLLFVPAWALLGGFSSLDSGHPVWFGMLVGALIGVVFGLGFGGYKGKIMDTLFGPEEKEDDK